MNLLIYTVGNIDSGLGHYYRMLALASDALRLGHIVTIACDSPVPARYLSRPAEPGDAAGFIAAVESVKPDWVVVDLPGELPVWVRDGLNQQARLCVIDGVGQSNGIEPDLVISQGLEGQYCAPEYLLLRPEVFRYSWIPQPRFLVFGGSADKMGLLPAFHVACPEMAAHLVMVGFIGRNYPDWYSCRARHYFQMAPKGGTVLILEWLASSSRAVLAMGMTVWEALTIGMPVWVFSLTERHLASAQAMAARGWVRAWPETGLPEPEALRAFLEEPFKRTVVNINRRGGERILRLMEATG